MPVVEYAPGCSAGAQSSLRFKLMCVQVIDELLGRKAVDFEKVDKHTAEANYR